MATLVLHDTSYTQQQLCAGVDRAPCHDYAQRVLQFCQQWLCGQETFTLHTSGSTGQPKTILLTRAQMVTSAHWTGQALGLQAGDHALVCLSATYIAGMMMLVRGFELGLHLTVIDPVSSPLAAFTPPAHFDFTAMVPLQLQETLHGPAHARALLDGMKGVLIGGAPVSVALEAQLQTVQAPLYHTYGMTETVSHIALRRLNGPHRSTDFTPFREVGLGVDARGCLTITSTLTRGETLYTNDLVTLHPDGSFRWLGRIDNVVNSGGVKVHIEQVERVLEAWLLHYRAGEYAHCRFFVGALPHTRLGQEVVVLFEDTASTDETTRAAEVTTALRVALRPVLAPYAIPRQAYFVPKFLETPTGKIDRGATLARLAGR